MSDSDHHVTHIAVLNLTHFIELWRSSHPSHTQPRTRTPIYIFRVFNIQLVWNFYARYPVERKQTIVMRAPHHHFLYNHCTDVRVVFARSARTDNTFYDARLAVRRCATISRQFRDGFLDRFAPSCSFPSTDLLLLALTATVHTRFSCRQWRDAAQKRWHSVGRITIRCLKNKMPQNDTLS